MNIEPAFEFQSALSREIGEVYEMLLGKNAAYGNSALDPLRVFSASDAEEQIRVRIDDKLSRLARCRGKTPPSVDAFFEGMRMLLNARNMRDREDTVMDLIGYLILLRMAG
jgi:hypothetical protein